MISTVSGASCKSQLCGDEVSTETR